MIATAADLAAALVNDLPPDIRNIEEAHFRTGSPGERRYDLVAFGP
jgi:hypothetical protein